MNIVRGLQRWCKWFYISINVCIIKGNKKWFVCNIPSECVRTYDEIWWKMFSRKQIPIKAHLNDKSISSAYSHTVLTILSQHLYQLLYMLFIRNRHSSLYSFGLNQNEWIFCCLYLTLWLLGESSFFFCYNFIDNRTVNKFAAVGKKGDRIRSVICKIVYVSRLRLCVLFCVVFVCISPHALRRIAYTKNEAAKRATWDNSCTSGINKISL